MRIQLFQSLRLAESTPFSIKKGNNANQSKGFTLNPQTKWNDGNITIPRLSVLERSRRMLLKLKNKSKFLPKEPDSPDQQRVQASSNLALWFPLIQLLELPPVEEVSASVLEGVPTGFIC